MRYLLTLLIVLSSVFSFAQEKKAVDSFVRSLPDSQRAVNDFAKFFTSDGRQWLENELTLYQERTSNAIVIITLDSLTDANSKKSYTIEEAALLYFNKWGIGDKVKNNGVLIMASRNERRVRIQVGKGFEGILTDFTCQVIIDGALVPNFKQGAFFKGMKEAVYAIENKLDKPGLDIQSLVSPSSPPAQQQTDYESEFHNVTSPGMGLKLAIFGFVIGVAFITYYAARNIANKKGGWYSHDGYRGYSIYDDSDPWKDRLSRSSSSGYSGGSASSGSSGSSSSSSSSGSYGGGSSSGGGASGSW
jgi:uncharacterized protein